LLGSIGFSLAVVAGLELASPLLVLLLWTGGGLVCDFFAGDLPVNGVLSGSVWAGNANATAKMKSETKSDFFIVECRDAHIARNVQSTIND